MISKVTIGMAAFICFWIVLFIVLVATSGETKKYIVTYQAQVSGGGVIYGEAALTDEKISEKSLNEVREWVRANNPATCGGVTIMSVTKLDE